MGLGVGGGVGYVLPFFLDLVDLDFTVPVLAVFRFVLCVFGFFILEDFTTAFFFSLALLCLKVFLLVVFVLDFLDLVALVTTLLFFTTRVLEIEISRIV
jgi:hypothetical protein